VSTVLIQDVRDRVLPMLRRVATEYESRVPAGFPVVLDDPAQGVVGIQLDPNHALYFVMDGDDLVAEFYYRSPRDDAKSSASREKFGGAPFDDRRPLPPNVSTQTLRNLIAELMSRWNFQPSIIHITES